MGKLRRDFHKREFKQKFLRYLPKGPFIQFQNTGGQLFYLKDQLPQPLPMYSLQPPFRSHTASDAFLQNFPFRDKATIVQY